MRARAACAEVRARAIAGADDAHAAGEAPTTRFILGQGGGAVAGELGVATLFGWLEKHMVRRSKVVIVICPQLEEVVREVDRDARPVLIENAPGSVSRVTTVALWATSPDTTAQLRGRMTATSWAVPAAV